MTPSFDLEDRFPSPARTHHKVPPTHPSRCYAQQPRSSSRSSYPLSTNLSHQLKINTASDPDTRLHLPSSSSQQTSRQASTSGNHLTVHCVAIDLTTDTVSHDILISKIAGSFLPSTITRWLSYYLRGRQAATVVYPHIHACLEVSFHTLK